MLPDIRDNQLGVSAAYIQISRDRIYLVELPNGLWIVKKVIAIPGDTIEIRDSRILVNDKPVYFTDFPNVPKTRIPPGYYYVYGNNQTDSIDSKFLGLIPKGQIKKEIIFLTPIILN